jgi:hypothetical protein
MDRDPILDMESIGFKSKCPSVHVRPPHPGVSSPQPWLSIWLPPSSRGMPLGLLLDTALSSLTSLSLRRRTSIRESLRSFGSSSSISATNNPKNKRNSSYHPYSVYKQQMPPTILRDPEAAKRLFEAILDSSNGRRALSRLARTCRAFCEPALDILWRDLDSLIPILGLFPGHVLKKARKPGLGFVRISFYSFVYAHQIDLE